MKFETSLLHIFTHLKLFSYSGMIHTFYIYINTRSKNFVTLFTKTIRTEAYEVLHSLSLSGVQTVEKNKKMDCGRISILKGPLVLANVQV